MKRVLVIDTDDNSRKKIGGRLETNGYAVLECNTGSEAVHLFQSGADAVVLSQGVAELGTDFWQDLGTINPAPSVVVVSRSLPGSIDASTLQTLRDGGFYLTAPPEDQPVEQAGTQEYRLPHQGINFYDLERDVLSQALRICHGNQTRAGVLLGLSRDQIRYRMAKFGLTSSAFQDGASSFRAA